MFRVKKALNHNTLIAIGMEDNQEYLMIGKGIGFGKKVSERMEAPEDCTVYSLREKTERGDAMDLVKERAGLWKDRLEHTFSHGGPYCLCSQKDPK